MVDTIFPQSPNWNLSKIISTREDGSVVYGSQNNIFILKCCEKKIYPVVIVDAHSDKVTSVAFSPVNKNAKIQNLVLSSSDDGYVKLWSMDSLSPYIGHNSHWIQKDAVKVVCASWSTFNPQYIISVAENDTVILWDILNNTTTRYFFSKLKPSVIESSFYDEKIISIGSKSGLVYIINLIGKGEIIHKLRGHDKEIKALSWCPILYYNNNVQDNSLEICYLASSCQDKEIFIWETVGGECVTKIQLPKNSLSKSLESYHSGKWDAAVSFIPIYWASQYQLFSGSKFGELICYDLNKVFHPGRDDMKNRQQNKTSSNYWKLIHTYHSNALLAVVGIPTKNTNFNVDSSTSETSRNGSNSNITYSNFGDEKHRTSDSVRTQNQSLIWTLGKDQKLVATSISPDIRLVFNFHTINGHAFALEASPHDPSKVAIGAGDGKIRLWNLLKPSGQVRVFWQKINDRVYSLAWHPLKEGLLAYGTSEGRVGIIDISSQRQPSNFIKRHHGKVYCLSWGPTCAENGQGCSFDFKDLSLYSVGGHKLLKHRLGNLNSETLKVSSNLPCKMFVDLSWKPDFTLLALGSKKGYIYLLKPPTFEVISSVYASTKCIMSFTWHPVTTALDFDCSSFHGYLTFASVDNESVIKVYNCADVDNCGPRMKQACILKGHSGYIQHVSWSPHVSGRLISCSADCSIRIWDVTTSTPLIKLPASQSILPLFSYWSPVDPDVVIAGYAERLVIAWRISTSSGTDPILKELKLEKGNIRLSELVNGAEDFAAEIDREFEGTTPTLENKVNEIKLAKRTEDQKSSKENRMFTKAWNPEIDPFLNCYELLKANRTESDPNYKLSFLESEESKFLDFLKAEAESLQRANNWNEHYQLALWRGNLKQVIEEKIAIGHLDDFLVSLAPFVSPRMWQEACASYSKNLIEKKCYRKAACYLMAIHKIREAIDVLANANLFLEAICIARCRLPKRDQVFLNLIRKYADWLTSTGTLLRASECFIYLNDFSEAVKVLARKNQPEHLSLAALASKRAGLEDLEAEYSSRALALSLENDKWDLASRICSDHPNLKNLSLLYKTHQLLYKMDVGGLTLDKDVITYLKEVTGILDDPAMYRNFQYTYDINSVNLDKKHIYVILAHELNLACCATEKDIFLTHLLRAMYTASKHLNREKNEIPILYRLSSWLSPKGSVHNLSHDSIFNWNDENIRPKVISLRAFLCLGIAELMRSILDQKVDPVDELGHFPALIDQLLNDALDKETYIYFRNQVEIKSIEKKINEAYKRKNQQTCIEPMRTDNEVQTKKNVPECLLRYLKDDPDSERESELSDDEIIATENEKKNRIKIDMRAFDNSRIIAPNPAFVYCTLREVLQLSKECEILNKVEEKWEELQIE